MTYDDEVLALYLKDINRIPLLTREEEITLSQKAKNGDKAAKDKIVTANLRFVVNIAKKYQNHGLDLTDLISEGNIGILTAIEKFEPAKGYHFISYAVWWIRQSILKAICEKSRTIRLPLNRANELVQIEHARKIVHGKKSETQEFEEDDGIIVIDEEDVAYVEIDATELFVKAKENFQNQNFQEALTLIIDFLELSNQQRDEALFLQGQIYESSWNGKNIKLAIESYENITKNFPSSSLWDKAKKRITYLKRFYLEAR